MSQPTHDEKRQQLQDELLALGSLVEELLVEAELAHEETLEY